jgi:hypothetical protein
MILRRYKRECRARGQQLIGLAATRGLSALFLAVLLSGLAPPAQGQSCPKMMEVRIQEWVGDIINLVPPWVAESEGIFRKHCSEVKFVPIASGPVAMSAMVARRDIWRRTFL